MCIMNLYLMKKMLINNLKIKSKILTLIKYFVLKKFKYHNSNCIYILIISFLIFIKNVLEKKL